MSSKCLEEALRTSGFTRGPQATSKLPRGFSRPRGVLSVRHPHHRASSNEQRDRSRFPNVARCPEPGDTTLWTRMPLMATISCACELPHSPSTSSVACLMRPRAQSAAGELKRTGATMTAAMRYAGRPRRAPWTAAASRRADPPASAASRPRCRKCDDASSLAFDRRISSRCVTRQGGCEISNQP